MKHFSTSQTMGKKGFITIAICLLFLSGCARQSNQSFGPQTSGNARLVSLGDGVCQETTTGKMWQVNASKSVTSLEDAQDFAGNLQNGDYNDWRLPTVSEPYNLYMIFDLHENGDCKLQVEGAYWSDEADLEGRVGTWELDDNCDPERQYIPKQRGLVRAIRS